MSEYHVSYSAKQNSWFIADQAGECVSGLYDTEDEALTGMAEMISDTMATREIKAEDLQQGQVILLAMGHTATVAETPKVGRLFVTYRTEHGTTRVRIGDTVLVEGKS